MNEGSNHYSGWSSAKVMNEGEKISAKRLLVDGEARRGGNRVSDMTSR